MKDYLKALIGPYYTPRMRHLKRRLEVRYLHKGEPELARLPGILTKDGIALDIGANIGDYLAVLARHSRRVIAFEPHPTCFAHLEALGLRNCDLVNMALSDREGTAHLRVPVDEAEVTGLATIEAANTAIAEEAPEIREYEVRTARLDDVIGEHVRPGESIDFIKIDVEGHELAVLQGAEATIAAHRPIVMVETEFRHNAPVADIFALFEARGFDARALVRGRFAGIDAAGLQALQQGIDRDAIVRDTHDSGYVNNVWFVGREQQARLKDPA